MNPSASSLIQATHAVLLGSLLSITLGLTACGSSAAPIGESEQPISAGDFDEPDSDPDGSGSDGSDPNTPVSSGPNGGGSSSNSGSGTSAGSPGCSAPGQTEPSDPTVPAACADAVQRDPTSDQRCDFVVGAACFDDAERACACAGCAAEHVSS